MSPADLSQFVRNTGRFQEIVSILLKYGLADWLRNTNAEWMRPLLKNLPANERMQLSREARVRTAITELGTTFIKLGQTLSTRPDLVGSDLAQELAELRSSTPPDPPETVQAIIQEELGAPVAELYQEFDGQALASASIGQVHKAKLPDGTVVVVKVQHPGIEERIRNDLEILETLAELAAKYAPQLRAYRPVETAAEFGRTLSRELDFRHECRNLERFRRNFQNNSEVHIPAPYADLSSRRVLTMDLLEGISMSDEAALRAADLDLEQVARVGASLFVDMIFRDAFYHADPHPGNLMVLVNPPPQPTNQDHQTPSEQEQPASRIGLLDCGMVGQLDESLRKDVERALLGVAREDSETVVEIIMQRGETPADLDPDDLRLDVEDFLNNYAHQSIAEFDLSGCLKAVVEIIRRHEIVLPAKVAMLFKVLIMLEGTAQQLSPKFNLAELIEPYARQSLQDKYSPQRLFKQLESRYRDWDRLLEILPRDTTDILHRLKTGSFDVHINHRRLDTAVNRLVLGILVAALFVGSTSLLNHVVPPLAWGISIPGTIGCAVAVWLGYSLIRAIKRMGDIQQK